MRSQAVRQALADRVHAAGARRREDALRFATWRLDAGGDMAPDLMVTAALTARNRWDLDLARRLADAAVRAGAGIEAALLRAEVAVLQGRGPEAEEHLAALLPQATNDAQRAAWWRPGWSTSSAGWARSRRRRRSPLDAEAVLTDPGPLDLVLAKRAFALQAAGRLREALDVLEPVLARAEGPPLAFAWWVGGACLVRIGRFAEAAGLQREVRRARRRPHRVPAAQPFPAPNHALRRPYRRRPPQGRRAAGSDGVLRRGGQRVTAPTRPCSPCTWPEWSWSLGKVADARHHALEAANLFREKQWINMSRSALTQLAMAHALGGSAEQARAALAELDALGMPPEYLNDIERDRARAWAAAADGDVSPGREHLLRTAAARARRREDFSWEGETLHDLARLGWPQEAAPRLRQLADLVEGHLAEARADHAAALVTGDPGRWPASP